METAKLLRDIGANVPIASDCLQRSPHCQQAHLGILLGNALQNAYDGAQTAPGGGKKARFVSIEGKRVHDNLVFVVTNGFSGPLDKDLKTTKVRVTVCPV